MIESSRGNGAVKLSQLPDLAGAMPPVPGQEPEEKASTPREPEGHGEIYNRLVDWIEDPNIARHVDQQTLDTLGMLCIREFNIDETSRADWLDKTKAVLKFSLQKTQPKEYPWQGSSNIIFPLITTAAVQFAARAYPAIIQNRNVVKGVVWGDDKGVMATQDGTDQGPPILDAGSKPVWKVPPGTKRERATKIGEHMSWQLLEDMPDWEPQTDMMLHQLPIVGGAVRKTFRDVREDCNRSVLVDLVNMVWNRNASSFEKAPRKSEILEMYPTEIEEMERDDEAFLAIVYGVGGAPTSPNMSADVDGDDKVSAPDDTEAPQTFIEQERRYDLDDDGYAEPLRVTVHVPTMAVVRIVANYEEDGIHRDKAGKILRIDPLETYTLYGLLPDPEGGSYPIGFGQLLHPLNEAINTTLNQMVDAAHLQIAGGGFMAAGMSIHSGNQYFSLGEYKPVNTKGMAIRDSVYQMQWPGPSEVLFQLLGFLVGAGKEVASIQEILSGDAALANTPPTTMLALVEQGLKVYTAIHKRVYRSLKSEFKKLYRLNRLYITDDTQYRVGDTWRSVTPEDYRLGGGVEPVSDPSMVTDMQRMGRAALLAERAKSNPLINPLEAERRLLDAAGIDRIDDLLPEKMPAPQPPPEMIQAQARMMEAQTRQADSQAKLGLTRAQAMNQYAQALMNFAKAKSSMNDGQIAWMEANLEQMRLHIEALNTTVRAADVDAKMHGHRVSELGHRLAHHAKMEDVRQRARDVADEQPVEGSADGGGGSEPPAPVPQPGGPGDVGTGVSAMAAQPNNASGLPLPGAPQ